MSTSSSSPSGTAPTEKSSKAKTIEVMVVDNHAMVAAGLKLLLENTKLFKVPHIATSAKDALAALDTLKPDLIILEPDLLDANGFDLIPLLLKKSNSKVMVLTALNNLDAHDQAIVKGARGVLKKTDSPELLIKAAGKIHEGELWVNREATSRILLQIAQATANKELSPEEIKLNSLTAKETKVSKLLHANSELTLKEISGLLHISEHTLRNHLSSIYQKLEVKNRLEFYVFASKYLK
ncbi:response regulator transcription factor [Polynucleobacter sp. MWH-Braz-FAM2G]|uniref:response regulator transcription factor n=1 Tax=Polynucleobacter sp. MWH-Braz-FAM2G TaxID=1855883 RepID=UPI001BFD7143|nr:response regulator transcription factor [Polynucleobacter sp. MWH-Braz-FAM2G]QWD89940.1 response regulator transcription factor [Polynucleobacter sp. MWH-Braz-FAM2G]